MSKTTNAITQAAELKDIKEGFSPEQASYLPVIDGLDFIFDNLSHVKLENYVTDDFRIKNALKLAYDFGSSAARAVFHIPSLYSIAYTYSDETRKKGLLSSPATWDFLLYKGDKFTTFLKTNEDLIARIIDKKSGLGEVIKKDMFPMLEEILKVGQHEHVGLSKPISELMSYFVTKPDQGSTIEVDKVIEKAMELASNKSLNRVLTSDKTLDHVSKILKKSYEVAVTSTKRQKIEKENEGKPTKEINKLIILLEKNKKRFNEMQPFMMSLVKAGMIDEAGRSSVTNIIKLFTKPTQVLPLNATEAQKNEHNKLAIQKTNELLDGLQNLLSNKNFANILSDKKNLDILAKNIMPLLEENPALAGFFGKRKTLSKAKDLGKNLIKSLVEDPKQIANFKAIIASQTIQESLKAMRVVVSNKELQSLVIENPQSSDQLGKLVGEVATSKEVFKLIEANLNTLNIKVDKPRLFAIKPFIAELSKESLRTGNLDAVFDVVRVLTTPTPQNLSKEEEAIFSRNKNKELLEKLGDLVKNPALKEVFTNPTHAAALNEIIVPIVNSPKIAGNLFKIVGAENSILESSKEGLKASWVSILNDEGQLATIGSFLATNDLKLVSTIIKSPNFQKLVVEDKTSIAQFSNIAATIAMSTPITIAINNQITKALIPNEDLRKEISERSKFNAESVEKIPPSEDELKFEKSIQGALINSQKAIKLSGIINAIMPSLLKPDQIDRAIDIITIPRYEITNIEGKKTTEVDFQKLLKNAELLLLNESMKEGLLAAKTPEVIAEIAMPIIKIFPALPGFIDRSKLDDLQDPISDAITSIVQNPNALESVGKMMKASALSERAKAAIEFVTAVNIEKDGKSESLLTSLSHNEKFIGFASGMAAKLTFPEKKDNEELEAKNVIQRVALSQIASSILPGTIKIVDNIIRDPNSQQQLLNITSLVDRVAQINKDAGNPAKNKEASEKMQDIARVAIGIFNSDKVKPFLTETIPKMIASNKKEVVGLIEPYINNIPFLTQNNISSERIANLIAEPKLLEQGLDIADSYLKGNKLGAAFKSIKLLATSKEARGIVGSVIYNTITNPFKSKNDSFKKPESIPEVIQEEVGKKSFQGRAVPVSELVVTVVDDHLAPLVFEKSLSVVSDTPVQPNLKIPAAIVPEDTDIEREEPNNPKPPHQRSAAHPIRQAVETAKIEPVTEQRPKRPYHHTPAYLERHDKTGTFAEKVKERRASVTTTRHRAGSG